MADQFMATHVNYTLHITLIFPIVLLILIIKFNPFKFSFASRSPTLPPGPTPWPLLGNIPHMTKSMPHIAFTNFSNTYGPIISLRLGTQCLIVGSSPDIAKEIFKTKDRIFSGRYVPQSIPITRSELNSSSLGWADECTDNWKRLRTLCRTELFSNKAMESQELMSENNINDLVSFLKEREGQVLKIAELVFVTVFNILGNALMSKTFISLDEKNEDGGLKGVIREAMEAAAAPNLADFYPILSKFDLQGLRKKSQKFYQRMQSVWGPIIEQRRNTTIKSFNHQDFLDTILDNGFTNNQINQLFTELFSAGTDTTTSTIEWTMAELLKNPESMRNVRAEIEREIKQGFPINFYLMNVPFLGACVKETMRLHPPAPLGLPHRALETCQVMNYTIPKNARVMVNLWAIGRDPSIWDEPLKFNPDRFLSSNIDYKGNDFVFLPFGGGRRICPGLPMAAKTIQLILVSLIHFFDWSLSDGKDPNEMNMNEKFGITMQMENPLMLIPRARKT